MRYQDEQTRDDHPEAVRSAPVPVPPADPARTVGAEERRDPDRDDPAYDGRAADRTPDEALQDRGTFDDPMGADRDDDGRVDSAAPDTATVDPDAAVDRDAVRDEERDAVVDRDAVPNGEREATVEPHAGRGDQVLSPDDDGDRTDATARDGLTDRGAFDDPVLADERADRDERTDHDDLTAVNLDDTDRDDERPFHEPAPQPTAFGAATVGGAAAASAQAGRPRTDVPDEEPTGIDDGVVDERSARRDAAADTAVDERREGFGPDERSDATAGAGAVVDRSADGQPVGEAAPATELLPGDIPGEPVAVLIAADAAQGLRDRWRDLQLRFVDDPRGAANDAQTLVNEAVQALTDALAAQRNDLGGWQATQSGDTEQLRMVVRRYREFLNRLLDI